MNAKAAKLLLYDTRYAWNQDQYDSLKAIIDALETESPKLAEGVVPESPVEKAQAFNLYQAKRDDPHLKSGYVSMQKEINTANDEILVEIAKTIRVHSGWDIGEEECITIAEKIMPIIERAKQEGYVEGMSAAHKA